MDIISFRVRNTVQEVFGLTLAHRIRAKLRPHMSTETGSCGCADEWIYIYPTWRCTLKCSYCQNLRATGVHNPRERQTMTPETWASNLNRIGRHVSISGGDPLVYPHLAELVNSVDTKLQIAICSDLSAPDTVAIVEEFRRPVMLDVTYHPCSGAPDRFMQTVQAIEALGAFEVTIHAIASGKSLRFLRQTQDKFLDAGLQLKIDAAYDDLDFVGSRRDDRQKVFCSKKNINIGPDGNRYPCVTKAIRMHDPLCNIADANVTAQFPKHLCHDYGHCAPGDLEEVGMTIEPVEESR